MSLEKKINKEGRAEKGISDCPFIRECSEAGTYQGFTKRVCETKNYERCYFYGLYKEAENFYQD